MRAAVVPAFNEEGSIKDVVQNLYKYVSTVIVVDDSSTDQTRTIAEKNGAHVLSNPINLGYEKSLVRGISFASSEGAKSILTFDADGQHPYEVINEMFKLVESGSSDVVIATRNYLPRISEKLFSWYTNAKYGITDILSGMKCYSTAAIGVTGISADWDSIGSYISLRSLKLNLNVTSVSIQELDRIDGASRFGISLKSELKIMHAFVRSLLI